jgi:uncharacterized membrane protein
MQPGRILRHLLATRRAVSRAFPGRALQAIERAVHAGERSHDGEIRFAVEAGLGLQELLAGETPRQRALEVFSMLRVWDTERNNGVLIYVLHADRDVEIVADRGLTGPVGEDEWGRICEAVRARFARGEFEAGALEGIAAVSRLMAVHFPAGTGAGVDRDEMPDRPVML